MVPVKDFINIISESSEKIDQATLMDLTKNVKVIKKDIAGYDIIKKAFELINSPIPVYTDLTYFFQTENLRYMKMVMPEKLDSAFTITGTGNSILELVNLGVKNIVSYDTNPLSQMVAKLFIASFLTLSSKDYDRFLLDYTNSKFLSLDVLKNIKDGFKGDEAAYNFWDAVLINDKEDLLVYLFKPISSDYSTVKYGMPFLKKYYDVRDKLEKVKIDIKCGDAIEYFNNNSLKFDYIDITNILLFIYQLHCNNDKEKFNSILEKLNVIYDKNLNDNGTFVLDYLFGTNINSILDKIDTDTLPIVKEAYLQTYEYLKNNFDLETLSVEKIVKANCACDTLLYSKKCKQFCKK